MAWTWAIYMCILQIMNEYPLIWSSGLFLHSVCLNLGILNTYVRNFRLLSSDKKKNIVRDVQLEIVT